MNALAAALVKAQKGFAPALKQSTNPHFKSKYVDLAGCVEAVIDSLNDSGIALMQHTHECADGVIVETVFMHESGETLSCGKLHVPAGKNDAQGYGSALTYARRYSLMAACGIAPEDDDGNAASKKPADAKKPRSVPAQELAMKEPAQQQFLQDLAVDVLASIGEEALYDAYTKTKSTLDSDEQVAFWAFFDSKTRATIKRIGEQRRQALAEQA